MTQLLVFPSGDICFSKSGIETLDDRYRIGHIDYLFSTVDALGGVIVDIELPSDFSSGGYQWDGTGFVKVDTPPPPPVVPQVVSRAQFILALLHLDLLDEVEAAIAQADRATQVNYKERLEFERNYPLMLTMAAVLGKTEAEIDGLFMLAATL